MKNRGVRAEKMKTKVKKRETGEVRKTKIETSGQRKTTNKEENRKEENKEEEK